MQIFFSWLRIYLLLAAILASSILYSQKVPSLNMIAAPSSPTAASLSRYVDFPVTMSSGVPNISIPLYEFQSSRITVPILLSYHAGGVRVTDRTSTLGLGWTLIAGGAITRSIVGVPDEQVNGFFRTITPDNLSEDYQGFYYQHNDNNTELQKISCYVNSVDNTGGNSGFNNDHSADTYYYNAQGLSGEFSYGNDGTIHTMPFDPIRIQNNVKTNSLVEKAPFIITGTDGVTYIFGERYVNGRTPATDYISVNNSADYASAWYLTKIISADKSDTVNFHYSTDYDSYVNTSVASSMRAGYNGFALSPNMRTAATVTKSQSSSTEYNVRLEDITGKNGRVHFNYNEDIVYSYHFGNTGYTFPSTIRPLSSIEVYANTGSEVKIKQFDLQYSYFNSIPAYAANSLRLDGVTEVGYSQNAAPQANPPYLFTYATNDVPPFNTNSRDLWGYYNGYVHQSGDNDNMLLVDLPVPYADETGYREPVNNFKKREVNPAMLDKGMLKSISYPTGGFSEFTFEPNSKTKTVSVSVPQTKNYSIRTMAFWSGSGTSPIDINFTPGQSASSRKLTFFGRESGTSQSYLEHDPQLILKDLTTGQIIIDKTFTLLSSGAKPSEDYSITLPPLDHTHQYRMYFPMPSTTIAPGQITRYDLTAYITEQLPPITATEEKVIYGGGLRVKTIEHRDNFTSGFIKKVYNYTESYFNSYIFSGDFTTIKEAFGKQTCVPVMNSSVPITILGVNLVVIPRAASYFHQESPSYSIGSPNSSISYSKVEELQTADDDKFIGKTEYTFNTGIDHVTNWRTNVKIDRSFIRSQLLNKKVYKGQPNDWQLIQETENIYNNINDLDYHFKGSEYIKKYVSAYLFDDLGWSEHGNINSPYPIDHQWTDPNCSLYMPATPLSFNIAYVNIVRPTLVSSTIKELGTAGNWLESVTNYEYDNFLHMKPTSITTTKSDGSKVRQQIKYSADVDIPYESQGNAGYGSTTPIAIPANTPVFSGIINLQLANNITPIETTTFIKHNGSNDELLLGSTFNYYNPLLPVIDSVAIVNITKPSDQFTTANIFKQPIDYHTDNLLLDAKYHTEVDFKYNDKGSLVQQHKANDLTETFLWGYNEQYPVARITGGQFDIAKNIISPSALSNTNSLSENDLRTELHKLRTHANLSNSLVQTYTFVPLLGMTSETDPAGRTSYYEYEPLGRLSLVRDQFNNIVKKYGYHYNSNKQTFTFTNSTQLRSFAKNDCPPGYSGVPFFYKVPRGKYYSTISQEDADNKALAEISLKGQTYANEQGNCTVLPIYYNKEMKMPFTRDDCSVGTASLEGSIEYTVVAGKYSSLISQYDADQQALDEIMLKGQIYINEHSTCSSAPSVIELKSGTDINAWLVVMNTDEEELFELFFPENSGADIQTIELPPSNDGYLIKFVVPMDYPYDPSSMIPYRFNLQGEGKVWRSNYYTGRSNTELFIQTETLQLRPGRTYTIKADQTWN